MVWLKDMLSDAWKREAELKSYIKSVLETNADALEIKVAAMERQTGRVREEVERWQMRNEELEQLLQSWMQKCWSLKQVIIEQQKLIKAHQQERGQYTKELARFRNESENAYSFAKYECNKYKKVITHDKVLQ